MKFKEYDVIIVGTGVSGLYAALNLDSSMQILMLSKRELTLCNSALAQGGAPLTLEGPCSPAVQKSCTGIRSLAAIS